MAINWIEFSSIAIIHFFAVASPGPDFAIVLKQSVQRGRSAALWTSFGIGSGILLHVAYSLLGISLIIKTTPWLFSVLLYTAAAYLCWIGYQGLISKAPQMLQSIDSSAVKQDSWIKSFSLGFVTNGLNPKATMFFLSVFTVAISTDTPFENKLFYGVYMALATTAWFSFLSFLISSRKIRNYYLMKGYIFDKLMGLVLILMAAVLLWKS